MVDHSAQMTRASPNSSSRGALVVHIAWKNRAMSSEPDDEQLDTDPEPKSGVTGEDLAQAYIKLNSGMSDVIAGADIGPILDQFRIDTSAMGPIHNLFDMPDLGSWVPVDAIPAAAHFDPPPLPIGASVTLGIAESAERMADLMKLQHEAIAQLVTLTATNLQHAEAQRATAERSERFTRNMSWGSLAVAAASLAAAVAAIVVTLTTGGS